MTKIVLVDFGGTLILPEVIHDAQEFRAEILKRGLPSHQDHANPEKLYKANRDFLAELCGITPDMKFFYRQPDESHTELTADQMLNHISTNLFQVGMFMSAKAHGAKMFPEGMIDVLTKIKSRGYELGLVSGVRTDIIDGMLQIGGCDIFDHVYAQPPTLGISNEQNTESLTEHGRVEYIIGDKYSDLEPAKAIGAKAIFATWGHASGGEEDIADFSINSASELLDIIR